MREASKAMNRRKAEGSFVANNGKTIKWDDVFSGNGIDLGSGDDLIDKNKWAKMTNVKPFDTTEGDCNSVDSYFENETFDFVHASQVIEHLHDPWDSMKRMINICKKKGFIVITMPCMVLYEGMSWPSNYNADHKSTWSLLYRRSAAPIHVYIPDFVKSFTNAECLLARLVDTNYCYKTWVRKDQTFNFEDGVECWNEIVMRRK